MDKYANYTCNGCGLKYPCYVCYPRPINWFLAGAIAAVVLCSAFVCCIGL